MSSKDGFNRTIPQDDRQRWHYSAEKIVIKKKFDNVVNTAGGGVALVLTVMARRVGYSGVSISYNVYIPLLGYLREVVEMGGGLTLSF